jgi:hypothetical protein
MEIIMSQRISPIPYISHAYGRILIDKRRKTQGDHHEIHIDITVILHKIMTIKLNSNQAMNRVLKP